MVNLGVGKKKIVNENEDFRSSLEQKEYECEEEVRKTPRKKTESYVKWHSRKKERKKVKK